MTDDTDNQSATQSPVMTWLIVIVAIVAAALPHAFFPTPLQLHMVGDLQAWLGIAVWAPAILAGVAFFFGVEFGAHVEPPRLSREGRAAAVVLAPIVFSIYMAARFEPMFSNMAEMRPWDQLTTAIPLYAVAGGLHALFWQGYVQDRAMANAPAALRVVAVTLLNLLVFAPFVIEGEMSAAVGELLPTVALESILVAAVFETGASVRSCMIARALCGVAFIWFQQATLL
jgi:hypothetical protein